MGVGLLDRETRAINKQDMMLGRSNRVIDSIMGSLVGEERYI